jgi:hypothetical protein
MGLPPGERAFPMSGASASIGGSAHAEPDIWEQDLPDRGQQDASARVVDRFGDFGTDTEIGVAREPRSDSRVGPLPRCPTGRRRTLTCGWKARSAGVIAAGWFPSHTSASAAPLAVSPSGLLRRARACSSTVSACAWQRCATNCPHDQPSGNSCPPAHCAIGPHLPGHYTAPPAGCAWTRSPCHQAPWPLSA